MRTAVFALGVVAVFVVANVGSGGRRTRSRLFTTQSINFKLNGEDVIFCYPLANTFTDSKSK